MERLTSVHGIGVDATRETVLRSVTVKASNDDAERYIILYLSDIRGVSI
jgi:hypothetical protein